MTVGVLPRYFRPLMHMLAPGMLWKRSRYCAFAGGVKLPSVRLSSTVMPVNRRRPSGTMAMPVSQNLWLARPVMSCPLKDRRPSRARSRPAMVLMSVVLPAPLGPTTQTSSPGCTFSETPHSAGAAP